MEATRRRFCPVPRPGLKQVGLGALVVLGLASHALQACGFHGDNISVQRGVLNWVYPNALYVQGAVSTAMQTGLLERKHIAEAEPLAFQRQQSSKPGRGIAGSGSPEFQRTVRNMHRLAVRLGAGSGGELPVFSMVLIGPVFWTVFEPGPDRLAIRPHANGPATGSPVVVTDAPAVAALVAGEVSFATALDAGLVRFYGDRPAIESIRMSLLAAFPGPGGSLGALESPPGKAGD